MALSPRKQLIYWTIGTTLFLIVVWRLRDVLLPFVVGLALAYLLDPLADRLERWGLSRFWATAVITTISLSTVMMIIIAIIPFMAGQLLALAGMVPEMATALQSWTNGLAGQYAPALVSGDFQLSTAFRDFFGTAGSVGGAVVRNMFSIGLGAVNLLLFVLVVPVVMIYMLADWDLAVHKINSWLPRDHANDIRKLGREVDSALAGFVRGQVTVCALVGIFYAVALASVGLNFGFTIGILAGITSFIPFFGAIGGGVLAIGVAVFQFWSEPIWILVVAVIFGAGQILEGNILTPRLVGKSIGLHPVWLLFALSAFGSLFGVVGMLLAVPLAAIVGVLLRFALEQYLTSPLYKGHSHLDDR